MSRPDGKHGPGRTDPEPVPAPAVIEQWIEDEVSKWHPCMRAERQPSE